MSSAQWSGFRIWVDSSAAPLRLNGDMDFYDNLVRVVSALAVVLSLMLVLVVIARRLYPGRWVRPTSAPLVRVLGAEYVGPRKAVMVVAVAGEYLIIGSTANDLVPLGRIQDPEQIRYLLGERQEAGNDLDPHATIERRG